MHYLRVSLLHHVRILPTLSDGTLHRIGLRIPLDFHLKVLCKYPLLQCDHKNARSGDPNERQDHARCHAHLHRILPLCNVSLLDSYSQFQ